MADYLCHHGIKGMKWGVRRFQNKDGSLTPEGQKRYSDEQYRRDEQIYGRLGARRIQRNVEKHGDSVSGARSVEARRLKSARMRAQIGGQVGAGVGAGVGMIVGLGSGRIARDILREHGNIDIDDATVTALAGIGASTFGALGSTLGRHVGRGTTMLSSGYSPDKYR